MSGRMRLSKWTRLYHNPNYKPPNENQKLKEKLRVQKIMKRLMESDFLNDSFDINSKTK